MGNITIQPDEATGDPGIVKNTGGPAFPHMYENPDGVGGYYKVYVPGMDLRPYAAIRLRIPDSGIDWLDIMIAKSREADRLTKEIK